MHVAFKRISFFGARPKDLKCLHKKGRVSYLKLSIMEFVISDDFLEGANVVEINYVNGPHDEDVVHVAFKQPPKFVPRDYRRHVQKLVEYSHKNMTYSYDTANDAQRNVARTTIRDAFKDAYYVRAFAEDVLPCHQFPCTTEVHHTAHIERTTYTIHNRLVFIVDHICEGTDATAYYTYTLRYSHADNVDRTKIKQIFLEAIAQIRII